MNGNIIPILFIVCSSLLASCASKDAKQECRVQQGEFLSTQTESGDLHAVNSIAVTMPFIGWQYGWRYKIIELVDHGDVINRGDTIALIDPSPVVRVLQEEQNKLEIELANYEKQQASHKSLISQLNSELATEKANSSLISLQVDKYKFEPEPKRKIKALQLEIAHIKEHKIERKVELQQIIIKSENNIQKTRIEQIKSKIAAAEKAYNKLTLTTPISGIAQLETNWRTGKMVQLGDETRQGWTLVKVPDMRAMKVTGMINETDIYKLKLGQEVRVRLDAYPAREFAGEISYIGRLSREKEEGSDLKVFDFEVYMKDSDPALKPGMTVSCQLILAEIKDALFVSNECILTIADQNYVLLEKGGNAEKVPVEILGRNSEHTAVSGKLKKGDKLLTKEDNNKQLSEL